MIVLPIEHSITDYGPSMTLDAIEFCRTLTRREPGTGLLTTGLGSDDHVANPAHRRQL